MWKIFKTLKYAFLLKKR